MLEQTALITGSAKRIGAQIAETLTKEGYHIAIHYHQSQSEAENLQQRITESGGKASIFRADLTNREQIMALIPAITATMPPLTVLINNASIFTRDEWHDTDFDSWDKHFMTNLEAPFWLSQQFAKQLEFEQPRNQQGNIINMIDQRVLKLTPHFTSYSIAKSALWTMTQTLALALAPTIRVNAIAPGPTLPSTHQTDEQFIRQYRKLPLPQATPTDDICNAVSFIIKQSSLTGQIIALDNGEHLGWQWPDKET